MSPGALGAMLLVCLGAGVADLAVLNLRIVPRLYGASTPANEPTVGPSARFRAAPVTASTPAPTQIPPVASVPAEEAEPTELPRCVAILEFEPESHQLDATDRLRLKQSLPALRGAARILVVGHADASGSEEFNQRLSAERAAAAVRQLRERGIPAEHIESAARGEREPRADGNSRRVEIYIGGEP